MKMIAKSDYYASFSDHQPTIDAPGPAPSPDGVQQLPPTESYETRAYDALLRIGRACGVFIDPDDPEQVHIATSERAAMKRLTRR